MKQIPRFRKGELDIVFELLEVLYHSLDMQQALQAAYPLLHKLVAADQGALCVSRADNPALYDWTTVDMPDSFFRGYEQIAEHDFVREAVAQRPNIVLCDREILPPQTATDGHPLYEFTRSKGVRVEQIMAVMLSSEPLWHGGLTLYRDRRRPFSEQEREILQFLTPYLSTAVANCKRFGDLEHWSSFLEKSLSMHRTSILVFSPSLKLVAGSPGIYHLLERCFGTYDAGRDGLPAALWKKLEGHLKKPIPIAPPAPWIPSKTWERGRRGKKTVEAGPGAGLIVTFVPVVKNFAAHWMVLFDEVPLEWRAKLTPTELDTVVRAALGWTNDAIADDLCNELATTKTHMFRIFDKLGIDNRSLLQARFRERG